MGLSELLTGKIELPPVEPRVSHSIEEVDAIRTDQTRIDPPTVSMQSDSSDPKKLPYIEPEVTQASLPFYSKWAMSHKTRYIIVEQFKELMRRIKRLRDPRLISKGNGRIIPINAAERGKENLVDERTGREYVDNLITSSRYTIYSFLPRQLWAQFSKVANLYILHGFQV